MSWYESARQKGLLTYDIRPELWFAGLLSMHLSNYGWYVVEKDYQNRFGPDLILYIVREKDKYSFSKHPAVHIEVEKKDINFTNSWPYPFWSFLDRKVKKTNVFRDFDYYALLSKDQNSVAFATFGDIRFLCSYLPQKDHRDDVHRLSVNEYPDFCHFGFNTLAKSISQLYGNNEHFTDGNRAMDGAGGF